MPSKAASTTTTDHEEIRRWAEERKAQPSCVRGTGGGKDIGMLRLDFPGYSGENSLEPISWDDWFEKFDERKLALLYQDTTASGQKSNFNKIISRETAEENNRGRKASRGTSTKRAQSTKGSQSAKRAQSHSKAAGTRKTASRSSSARQSASSTSRGTQKRSSSSGATSKRASSSSGRKQAASRGRKTRTR